MKKQTKKKKKSFLCRTNYKTSHRFSVVGVFWQMRSKTNTFGGFSDSRVLGKEKRGDAEGRVRNEWNDDGRKERGGGFEK